MLSWALRVLGARIGSGVFLDTTDLTEFDCVRIGEEAELNAWCGPQTHVCEDRVMKLGEVEIGGRVTIGPTSKILHDTHIGECTQLWPLTLIAKGERVPAGTRWTGSPVVPAVEQDDSTEEIMNTQRAHVVHAPNVSQSRVRERLATRRTMFRRHD